MNINNINAVSRNFILSNLNFFITILFSKKKDLNNYQYLPYHSFKRSFNNRSNNNIILMIIIYSRAFNKYFELIH